MFVLVPDFGDIPSRAPPSLPPKPTVEVPGNKPDTMRNVTRDDIKKYAEENNVITGPQR